MIVPCWITSVLSAFLIADKRCAITKEYRALTYSKRLVSVLRIQNPKQMLLRPELVLIFFYHRSRNCNALFLPSGGPNPSIANLNAQNPSGKLELNSHEFAFSAASIISCSVEVILQKGS